MRARRTVQSLLGPWPWPRPAPERAALPAVVTSEHVPPDRAWLITPDFVASVGRATPPPTPEPVPPIRLEVRGSDLDDATDLHGRLHHELQRALQAQQDAVWEGWWRQWLASTTPEERAETLAVEERQRRQVADERAAAARQADLDLDEQAATIAALPLEQRRAAIRALLDPPGEEDR